MSGNGHCQLERRRALESLIESDRGLQSTGTRHCLPFDERSASQYTVKCRPQQMPADPEEILDDAVYRREAL